MKNITQTPASLSLTMMQMPSGKHNSIMAKVMGLIFHCLMSLQPLGVPQGVPQGVLQGVPQGVQCILHGLTSVLLCVPFIFADSPKGINLVVTCDAWLPFVMEIVCIFHSSYFDCRGAV